jgi:hypothetical protein
MIDLQAEDQSDTNEETIGKRFILSKNAEDAVKSITEQNAGRLPSASGAAAVSPWRRPTRPRE